MAGCQTGDNPWAKEEAPLSVSQASAFPVRRASVTASCLGAGEGGSEGGGTPPHPQSSATSSPATFVLSSKRRRSGFKGSQTPH